MSSFLNGFQWHKLSDLMRYKYLLIIFKIHELNFKLIYEFPYYVMIS